MAPGFHIFVYANLNGKVLSDSAYYPIATINSHPVEIQAVQLKNHLRLIALHSEHFAWLLVVRE